MKLQYVAFIAVVSSNFAFANKPQQQQPRNRQEETGNVDVGILSGTWNNTKTHDNAVASNKGYSQQKQNGAKVRILSDLHSCQDRACIGSNLAFYVNNTCNGHLACLFAGDADGYFAAGSGTCLGEQACMNAALSRGTFKAGDASCYGKRSCYYGGRQGYFTAGNYTCRYEYSCYKAGSYDGWFEGSHGSCIGERACLKAAYRGTFRAGDKSCVGERACMESGRHDGTFQVGGNSCRGSRACYRAGSASNLHFGQSGNVTVGDSSCRGTSACVPAQMHTNFTIGDNSCGCDHCCENLMEGSEIGDCQCNDLSDGCSNATEPVIMLGSCQPSISPSTIPSFMPTYVSPLQNLTFDASKNLLGLTGSDITVSLAHLVNDNKTQRLGFDNGTNQLMISNSMDIVDLSHLDQDLLFDEETKMLGLSNSHVQVDLSPLAQDLSLQNNTLDISGGGKSAELSSLRVITLQASIGKIDGDDTSRLSAKRANRRLKGDKDGPKVKYGGEENSGITLIASGRLVGISITAKYRLKKGIIEVGIVDCTDNMDNTQSLGQLEDVLILEEYKPRNKAKKFPTPIPVNAGVVLCFQVIRIGKVDSEEKDNVASLVLMLEQW